MSTYHVDPTSTGKSITAATQANPCSVTCTSHGFSTGDKVFISDVVGMTELNGNVYTITVVDADTYTLGVDSTAYTEYTSGGKTFNGSQATPYNDLQIGVSVVADGDTILCKGTQTLTSSGTDKISFSGLAGTAANGGIKITGVNSSWSDDGTKFTLDGNSANGTDGIGWDGAGFIFLSNFEVKNCQGKGITSSSSYCNSNYLKNVYSTNNTGDGFYLLYFRYSVFEQCRSESNSDGIEGSSSSSVYIGCVFINNTYKGLNKPRGLYLVCISVDNGNDGFGNVTSGGAFLVSCVIDGNAGDGVDGYYIQNSAVVVGCRVTNNGGYGLKNTDSVDQFTEFYNLIVGNTSGAKSGYWFGNTGTETTGTIGYNSPGSPDYDYNLTSNAAMRDVSITLPE